MSSQFVHGNKEYCSVLLKLSQPETCKGCRFHMTACFSEGFGCPNIYLECEKCEYWNDYCILIKKRIYNLKSTCEKEDFMHYIIKEY